MSFTLFFFSLISFVYNSTDICVYFIFVLISRINSLRMFHKYNTIYFNFNYNDNLIIMIRNLKSHDTIVKIMQKKIIYISYYVLMNIYNEYAI